MNGALQEVAPIVPDELLRPHGPDELRGVDRNEAASLLDGLLRRLSRQEALGRRVLGRLADRFIASGGCGRLGFARVGDYARERLGISGRELHSLAAVARRLDELPTLALAFEEGRINWTQLRTIAPVATSETAAEWLELARRHTSRELSALIKKHRRQLGADCRAGSAADDGRAVGSASRSLQAGDADLFIDDEQVVAGEPLLSISLRCPRRVRSLWREAAELASRASGGPLSAWQALEVVVAEASSAIELTAEQLGALASTPPAVVAREPRSAGRGKRLPAASSDESSELAELRCLLEDSAVCEGLLPDIAALAEDLDMEEPSAHELDRRMRAVIRAGQQIDWQMGSLLMTFTALRLSRALGFASMADYVVERLGISVRKARALASLERKAVDCSTALREAFRSGRLSWVRAVALLPVVSERHGDAWVERAQAVTVRRLFDEVRWAREMSDRGAEWLPIAPPPLGAVLDRSRAQVERQMRSELDAETIEEMLRAVPEATVTMWFTGPASVIEAFCELVTALRRPDEWPWQGFERLLLHAKRTWEALPDHPNPIHARDGWRCRVPACSSRRNLQEHHLIFRSHGGSEALSNRVSVCASHHQRGIHGHEVRAWGDAQAQIRWQLGVRRDGEPLLSLRDDVYVAPESSYGGVAQAAITQQIG